jgi:flagellar motor switch protein FliN/FliY
MTPLQTIEGFADLKVDLEIEVDRKSLTLRQILELGLNSVVKLTRSAGENIDVLVGGVLVCHGEIVIIENAVGIRITDFREED